MPVKYLITNQVIGIDAHTAGMITPDDLKGVHLHKTILEGKLRGKQILIPIDGSAIKYRGNWKNWEKLAILRKISRELRKYPEKLKEFGEYIGTVLNSWGNGGIDINQARSYAKGMAERLGLRPDIEKEFTEHVNNSLIKYISMHLDSYDAAFWIEQSKMAITAGPGKIYITKYYPRATNL